MLVSEWPVADPISGFKGFSFTAEHIDLNDGRFNGDNMKQLSMGDKNCLRIPIGAIGLQCFPPFDLVLM